MFTNLIDRLGGPSAVARHLGVSDYTTVSSWARRGSIPVRYWPGLMAVAKDAGFRLTADDLLRAHATHHAAAAAGPENHDSATRQPNEVGA